MFENETIRQRALLIAVDTGAFDSEVSLDELEELAQTAGAEVICRLSQRLPSVNKATYTGTGKLKEIKEIAEAQEIDLIIADDELSGIQLKNLEAATGVSVIDRTMLILDIFASRALTNEGKLQVELARQKYRLPRLVGLSQAGHELSKQQGGIGSRGSGESKLEYDRRHIRRRIETLQNELSELSERRERTREKRRKNEIPTIAIMGYTNVGKSTLLNKLTGASVLVKDMLFATLDPTARGLELSNGQTVLMIDTVGLLRRLPHQLIKAFHSTLEEAASADLILELCDISSPELIAQLEVTNSLLDELGCGDIKRLTVYNKTDKLSDTSSLLPISDKEGSPKGIMISAKNGEGIDVLLSEVEKALSETMQRLKLLIPYTSGELVDFIRKTGKVISESFENDGILITANVENKSRFKVSDYIVE